MIPLFHIYYPRLMRFLLGICYLQKLFYFIDDGRVKYFYAEQLTLDVILISSLLIVAISTHLGEMDCDLLNTMNFKIDYCFKI